MEKNRHGRNRRRNRNWNEQKKNTNENSFNNRSFQQNSSSNGVNSNQKHFQFVSHEITVVFCQMFNLYHSSSCSGNLFHWLIIKTKPETNLKKIVRKL